MSAMCCVSPVLHLRFQRKSSNLADALRCKDSHLAQEWRRQHWLRAARTGLDVVDLYRLQRL
jgi:hypothetical protein